MRIIATPTGPYQPATSLLLSVADAPDGTATFEWQAAGSTIAGASGTSYRLTTGAGGTAVEHTAIAKDASGAETGRAAFTVVVREAAPAAPPAATPAKEQPQEPVLVYDRSFAMAALVWTLLIAAAGLSPLAIVLWRVAVRPSTPDGELSVTIGGLVAIGLLIVGSVIACAGIFGALLEVRGRLRTVADRAALGERGALPDAKGVIEAIGKLRGAAMILVIACVPLLASAWIGHSAVDQPSPTSTTIPGTAESTPATTSNEGANPTVPGDG